MTRLIGKLVRDRRGAAILEYGLLLAMIALVMVAGMSMLGGGNGTVWGNFTAKISDALPS